MSLVCIWLTVRTIERTITEYAVDDRDVEVGSLVVVNHVNHVLSRILNDHSKHFVMLNRSGSVFSDDVFEIDKKCSLQLLDRK